LNPALDVSQYAHTSWKIRDGFTKGQINSIAQTPDGYLWLGTDFGLLRFDGFRNVPWQPPLDQHLPSDNIRSLVAARDGTLWIGTAKGLVSWKDGKLRQYAQLDGQYIFKLLEDREGSVWVGGGAVPRGRLCLIRNGSVECHGDDGKFGLGVIGLYEDSKGNLWAGVRDGLWRWKSGPPKFYALPGEANGIQALSEDTDGALLVGLNGGIHRLVDGKTEAYGLSATAPKFQATMILRDRDGSLWIGIQKQGLLHVHQGKTDVFAPSDGLSGEDVTSLFEDHEGNIWLSTVNGLERFRDFAVETLTMSQGLSSAVVGSVLAARDGSLWFGTRAGLDHWNNGKIISSYKLNGRSPNSIFEDDRGRIWVSTVDTFGYVENDRLIPLSAVPGGSVLSITQDRAGDLWIAHEQSGLFRLLGNNRVEQIPWAKLGHKDHASILAADSSRGGLWVGFFLGGVAYLVDGQVRAAYSATDGLSEGRVSDFRIDPDGTVWIATEGGLSRLRNDRIATITTKNGLPCERVHWLVEDDAHSFWLYTACGLLRIERSQLDGLASAVEKDKDARQEIQVTLFDAADGVRSLFGVSHFGPQVAKATDGKLWFLPWDGVSVVDPRHLRVNKVPPPVHIEQITADRQTYNVAADGSVRLRRLVRDIQIDYTALSLVAPEKIRFRYKLEGYDHDWQEAGDRRSAFYTNLRPGNYTFRVIACNNNGVWNESGAAMSMIIPPAFYQTYWFLAACVLAAAALIWALYLRRVRQVAAIYKGRMEERVQERERIARDLHDTFLQSVQGLVLKFDAIAQDIPQGETTRQALEQALDRADEVLSEGRDRVRDLRETSLPLGDLPTAFKRVVEETPASRECTFKTVVEGKLRDLHPMIFEEIYYIGREAILNALMHSEGSHVEAEITYDSRQFRLRIRDDGRGFDTAIIEHGGRPNHWGLPGMRERAHRIGAQLELWSRSNAGTEVELRIPGATAYGSLKSKRKRWWFRQLSALRGDGHE
jgi:ligand-binding sensor domain-containing protein/signal transduction histidine kinase